MLNGHDLDVHLPRDDDVGGQRCLRWVGNEDAADAPVSLRPQSGFVAELPRFCATTHTHARTSTHEITTRRCFAHVVDAGL